VDLLDDLPPARRPLFFPVVIATVFLSVIGMSAGLVLGSRHTDNSAASQPTQPQVTVFTTAPGPTPTGPACRPETQTAARQFGATGTLRIVLLLRTAYTAVWICQDDAGRLYYHANRGGEKAKWLEGQTALFLTGVQRTGEGFEVTASDGTRFLITSKQLYIVHKNGNPETQSAID
jgi:hypothetical protein